MRSISLFSGAGGMDVGFVNAGFEPVWANDIDKDACKTYSLNHGNIIRCGCVEDWMHELNSIDDIDCVFGGPPCQGFSVAGKMDLNDPRSQLVMSFMEVVRRVKPKCFVMENVKSLALLSKFESFRSELRRKANEYGYLTDLIVLNASDYGVPQARERMFFVGMLEEFDKRQFRSFLELRKVRARTVRETLQGLPKPGEVGNEHVCNAKITIASKPVLRKSPYAGMMFNGQGRPLKLDGYASTLPASMGGNRTPIVDEAALYESREEWIHGYHSHLLEGGEPNGFKSAPSYLRRITVDEALALQSFPKGYLLHGRQSALYRQIGNAVPCELAHAVADVMRYLLESNKTILKEERKQPLRSFSYEPEQAAFQL
ncbi:DNA cytosine methyltransferase [Endozoicomonas sp. Mp262]